jgi:hypothetical protein
MSQRVIVIGPNLYNQKLGQFHVHAKGCADIRRDPKRYGYDATAPHMAMEAETLIDVVNYVYSDIIAENASDSHWAKPEAYLDEFHFAPCVELSND